MKAKNTLWICRKDGTEICRECKHPLSEYGESHYPDCRYYFLDDEYDNDEIEINYKQRSEYIKTAA
ncbi:MAG TPA: hypothetical protein PK595_03030 [Bacteroidota bacterium]|jgi:hypothetical protein|nr:hypothetical protein [Bacteroidota bacterium]